MTVLHPDRRIGRMSGETSPVETGGNRPPPAVASPVGAGDQGPDAAARGPTPEHLGAAISARRAPAGSRRERPAGPPQAGLVGPHRGGNRRPTTPPRIFTPGL